MIVIVFFLIDALTVVLKHLSLQRYSSSSDCFYSKIKGEANAVRSGRNRKKPQWVTDEVIRIKALLPNASCRIIAALFNHRFGHRESIGKTFVGYTLRHHLYDIQVLRRKIKSRPAHSIPFNKVWGMDFTFVQNKPVLGVIEHHSRGALKLVPLKQKTSIAILRALLDILETNPKPQYIRTDNEACFNSKLIRFALWVLGIKHQTIDIHCPWQNGRVERFFGTLKSSLATLPQQCNDDMPYLIHSFAFWYNHIRTHQNLNGLTPESVFRKQLRLWYQHNPPYG
ncbi:MAG TPA: transposase [Chromatiales bacterium]|nr:transposase [Thiotrichales bacterium]HIP67570.1 transposase [Chromatiales bacterium]